MYAISNFQFGLKLHTVWLQTNPGTTLLSLSTLPTNCYRHRVRRRFGVGRFFYHKKKFSHYAPVIPWESVYTTSCIHPSSLHDPSLTYGVKFDSYVFMPQLYSQFLSTAPKRLPSFNPKSYISEFRSNVPSSDPSKSCAFATSSHVTPIVIDSGATFGTTPFVEDIIPGTLEATDLSVKNLSGSSSITARGFGRWCVKDVHNTTAIIEPFLHVVPQLDVRLLSPQDYFRGLNAGSYKMDKDTSWLTLPNGKRLEVPYHHANSLPMLFESLQSLDLNLLSFDDLDSANIHLNVADERNQNISAAQKGYILKHRMCSHANQQWCQELMRPRTFTASDGSKQTLPPVITTKHPGTKSAQKCICAGCMLGNLNRRSTKSSTTSNTSEMTLKQSHIYPGSLVFADQYESSVPGRRYETFGRENQLDKFKGGTLFYDAMSTLIYINHQSSSYTSDSLASKHKFEAFADLCTYWVTAPTTISSTPIYLSRIAKIFVKALTSAASVLITKTQRNVLYSKLSLGQEYWSLMQQYIGPTK